MAGSAELIVAIVAIGMGLSFAWADIKSPTSRALALALCLLGIDWMMTVPSDAGVFRDYGVWWIRAFAIAEGAIFVTFLEWVLRVGGAESWNRSASAEPSASAERLLRLCQALAVLSMLLGICFPEVKELSFIEGPRSGELTDLGYLLFAVPLYLSLGLLVPAFAMGVYRSQADRAEQTRVAALLVAAPFLMSGLLFRSWHSWRPIGEAIGLMIFLAGAVRYHTLQGQRGQFMGRFLAPEVGRLIRERGFSAAMQESRVELSVVACDLRGFTAFADGAAPEEVMKLLRSYYSAIGEAATEFGGTIESFAGDGAMVLVGAPLLFPDHAPRAIELALKILERGDSVLALPRRTGVKLGIGVGVASGYVTVGVIGSAARLEYVAVGPALNLASRLCARAEAGRVLTDQRTVALLEDDCRRSRFNCEQMESVELKGFARPVTVFAVSSPP